MATTDYDPATRRRLGIDPPLQRSIGTQQCPGCAELVARFDELERNFATIVTNLDRYIGRVDREVAQHITANHRHIA